MDNHTPVSPNHLEKRYNEGIRKITWRDKLIKMALGALLIDWKKLEMMIWKPTTGSMMNASRMPFTAIDLRPGSDVNALTSSPGNNSQTTNPITIIRVPTRSVSRSVAFMRFYF